MSNAGRTKKKKEEIQKDKKIKEIDRKGRIKIEYEIEEMRTGLEKIERRHMFFLYSFMSNLFTDEHTVNQIKA